MKLYPSDLTDHQWKVIELILDDQRKRKYPLRQIWNAIFYMLRTGCQWRMLPRDYAPWQVVYYYYSKWKNTGVIEQVHETLREMNRKQVNRDTSPSAGIIDSQSVKTTKKGGVRGFDGGKKVNGRKRHIVVDTMGFIMTVVVHAANIHDSIAAHNVFFTLRGRFPRLKVIFADGGYRGELVEMIKDQFRWIIEIVQRKDREFNVLPKRWIVERTFAWLGNYRRLSKDYEYLTDTSEAMIQLSMIRLMINRL